MKAYIYTARVENKLVALVTAPDEGDADMFVTDALCSWDDEGGWECDLTEIGEIEVESDAQLGVWRVN